MFFFFSRYSKGGILVPFGEAWREGGGISFDVNYDFYVGGRSLSGGRSIYIVKVGAACRLQCLTILSSLLRPWINGINGTKGAHTVFLYMYNAKVKFSYKNIYMHPALAPSPISYPP